MKIHISNLGVVNHAEIELKPLTVFLGENGTGKTWVAYTIAGLLGPYGCQQYTKAYIENKTELKFEVLEDAIQSLIDKGSATINLESFLSEQAEVFFNEVAKLAPQWLAKFMATKRVNFENTKISFGFTSKTIAKIITNTAKMKLSAELSVGSANSVLFNVKALKEKNSGELYCYTTLGLEGEVPVVVKQTEIRKFFIEVLFRAIRTSVVSNTPIFPTERTTFVTLPFGKIENEGSGTSSLPAEEKIKNNRSELLLSEPVKYFLAMLKTSEKKFFERKEEQEEQPEIDDYIKLSRILQAEVLRGKIELNDQQRSVEVLFSPKEGINLELNVSSSMTKELASLSIYLEYLAQPNDLVVIDEPEMNLHPLAQLEVTEFLSILSNSQLGMLITTHSPYIVDHIQNLILAAKHKNPEKIKSEFFLEDERAFLAQENVSVYLFDEGEVKTIISDDGIIDWSTFGDATRSISEIRRAMRNLSCEESSLSQTNIAA